MLAALHFLLIPLTFALGSAVGSFANVCIYRIPWQKSILWPDSRCPRCLRAIAARDNVPILGWFLLGGRCRSCGLPIAARYPLVEALVGLLFVAAYVVDVYAAPDLIYGDRIVGALLRAGYHQILISLLVVATFIDYDLFLIPDAVTVTGMALGLGIGVLAPEIRPEPSQAETVRQGAIDGVLGLVVGGGLVWVVRILGSIAFRKEAMGFGDVTLLAMIGAFLGWQAAILTFFLAPFFGLVHASGRIVLWVREVLTGRKVELGEIPFGPYLSMAALTLMFSWPWLWPGWARELFQTFGVVFLFLIGRDT